MNKAELIGKMAETLYTDETKKLLISIQNNIYEQEANANKALSILSALETALYTGDAELTREKQTFIICNHDYICDLCSVLGDYIFDISKELAKVQEIEA